MFRFISFIKFLLTSNNQHGVHSPFVYDYITKCLYLKKELKLPATLKVIIKSIGYFEYKSVFLVDNYKTSQEIIKQHCNNITFVENNADIILAHINELDKINIDFSKLPNDCMLLLDGIHQNKNNKVIWEYLKTHEHVRVTIDMFYCGAVFFRKEQVKEHFKIRI
ncbi:hypothetical protein PXD56_05920 [Maribacter sp. SA7]|uniref:hypothetical protein n=1 Tax=Maribacter zhoushanensis TaxID=3030012 RepID=UPI0023EB0BBE|nr:hypothetical protein [Maribacter zhoushanensis]MDF4202479.1 hypothetical protein [Maribacter zhoushanensis]